ncbi:hypothetical protein V1527DRAFT_415625, partial [Lipomyces starkeyi]
DCTYPRLSYSSVTETVTVLTVPKDLHEVTASELRHEIMKSIEEYLSDTVPKACAELWMLDLTMYGDLVAAISSIKQADGLFMYRGRVAGHATVAFDVGFSQKYDCLLANKDMWIQGCHACVLICLNESPRFL